MTREQNYRGFLILLIFLLAFPLSSKLPSHQKQKQEIPPEKHEVEVRLVLVDVIVTREGKFVRDLSKEEFELFEDGKKILINSIELISFEQRSVGIKEEKKVVQTAVRPKKKLVVLFDGINSWRRDIKVQSERIIKELLSVIELGNEISTCLMTSKTGLEILHPFTSDKELIRKSVAKASGTLWRLGKGYYIPPHEDPGPGGVNSQGDRTYSMKVARREHLFREKFKFEKTIGGLLAVINMIKDVPGRKSILIISAGIPDMDDPDHRYMVDNLRFVDPFKILKKEFNTGTDVIKEMIRYANAGNISIYSLDSGIYVKKIFSGVSMEVIRETSEFKRNISKLIARDKLNYMQNLLWISEDTGADSLRGAKKFQKFRQVMKTDLNNYYLLSFYPTRTKPDSEYHKIKVKVNRGGVKVRHRKGYTDYTTEGVHKMELVTAFYNPSLFTKLPFKVEFVPFYSASGKCEPWMNISLPVKEIFINRFVDFGPRDLNLHIWITNKQSGEKGSGGQIKLPFKIDNAFMEYIKTIDYMRLHFKGPEQKLKHGEYRAVFALTDQKTDEIGAYESIFQIPDVDKNKEGAILNCVIGDVKAAKGEGKPFELSQKDGSLEVGRFKFTPRVAGDFKLWGGAYVFLQVYYPGEMENISPEFCILSEDRKVHILSSKLFASLSKKKTKIWNGIFFLDISKSQVGKNSLVVEIPGCEEGSVINRELKLKIIQ